MPPIRGDDMAGLIPFAVIVALVVVAIGLCLRLSLRVVHENQRMVIFRMGRTNLSLLRGPGRVFLIPIVDREVLVDMTEREMDATRVAGTTADGHRIAADVSLRIQVVDALKSVVNVAMLDLSIQRVVALQLDVAARTLSVDEVHSGHALEDATLRLVEPILGRWGVRCLRREVTNVGAPEVASA